MNRVEFPGAEILTFFIGVTSQIYHLNALCGAVIEIQDVFEHCDAEQYIKNIVAGFRAVSLHSGFKKSLSLKP